MVSFIVVEIRGDRTADLLNAIRALSQLSLYPHIGSAAADLYNIAGIFENVNPNFVFFAFCKGGKRGEAYASPLLTQTFSCLPLLTSLRLAMTMPVRGEEQ